MRIPIYRDVYFHGIPIVIRSIVQRYPTGARFTYHKDYSSWYRPAMRDAAPLIRSSRIFIVTANGKRIDSALSLKRARMIARNYCKEKLAAWARGKKAMFAPRENAQHVEKDHDENQNHQNLNDGREGRGQRDEADQIKNQPENDAQKDQIQEKVDIHPAMVAKPL